eukprot:8076919-Pyramimonas_sp.AAC.1
MRRLAPGPWPLRAANTMQGPMFDLTSGLRIELIWRSERTCGGGIGSPMLRVRVRPVPLFAPPCS